MTYPSFAGVLAGRPGYVQNATPLATITLAILLMASLAPVAARADGPVASASTTDDATIAVDRLHVLLRPLSKDQLEMEVDGWLELLQAKINEVGKTELKIKDLAEGETNDALTTQLVELRTEETALIERTQVVLDAFAAKGGDVTEATQFITAISDIGEVTDTTSRWAMIIAMARNWLGRDDGGIYWLKRVILALVIVFVFWMISKVAGRIAANALARHPRASSLLENFVRRTTGGVVMVVGVLMALAAFGVEIGPMMAALGAGGFIVGFALQETLGSFASGLMIMVYRPFDVNDYVSIAGAEGTVKEMSLVSTSLVTLDNKGLVIPNKKVWGETITNYTSKNIRRVDLVFGIGYGDNIQKATDVLLEVARAHELVLDEPAVDVRVDTLGDSSVNLFCRPWTKTSDYWTVHWDLTRQVKERFDAEGISIPFPQRDVHVFSEAASD